MAAEGLWGSTSDMRIVRGMTGRRNSVVALKRRDTVCTVSGCKSSARKRKINTWWEKVYEWITAQLVSQLTLKVTPGGLNPRLVKLLFLNQMPGKHNHIQKEMYLNFSVEEKRFSISKLVDWGFNGSWTYSLGIQCSLCLLVSYLAAWRTCRVFLWLHGLPAIKTPIWHREQLAFQQGGNHVSWPILSWCLNILFNYNLQRKKR